MCLGYEIMGECFLFVYSYFLFFNNKPGLVESLSVCVYIYMNGNKIGNTIMYLSRGKQLLRETSSLAVFQELVNLESWREDVDLSLNP